MKSVLLLVDTRNILHSLYGSFNEGKIDYTRYISEALGEDIMLRAIAYGSSSTDSKKFRDMLKAQGFDVKFKDPITKPDPQDPTKVEKIFIGHDVDLAVDALTLCDGGKVDRVVIGSNSAQFVSLILELKRKSIRVEVFACRVPRVIRDVADGVREIDQSLLLNHQVV